jgi:predicted  nucleic acid-binding Zn-ribbon protein
MPHQCTGCGRTFEDGSKEMLSGCPDCGGNKFQFRPEGTDFPDDPDPPEAAGDDDAVPEEGDSSMAETVGRATTRVRDFVSSTPDEEPDPNATWPSETGEDAPGASDGDDGTDDGEIIDADARRETPEEDTAQSSARSGLASAEEVRDVGSPTEADDPDPDSTAGTDGAAGRSEGLAGGTGGPPTEDDDRIVSEPSDEEPELSELREQLNDQFESIKIVEPGQYELNLMELYDREEYIIALQENGRYVIQVPDQWIGNDIDER